jgi:hypothetical protein
MLDSPASFIVFELSFPIAIVIPIAKLPFRPQHCHSDCNIVIPSLEIVIPTEALAGLSFRPERSEVEESLRSFDFAQDDTLIVIPSLSRNLNSDPSTPFHYARDDIHSASAKGRQAG